MPSLLKSGNITLLKRESVKLELIVAIQETLTMTAGQVKSYNLNTILGAETAAKYNMGSVEPVIYVMDTEVGSPTNGMYVEGSAVVALGFNLNGNVTIKNEFTSSLNVLVRIKLTKKPN